MRSYFTALFVIALAALGLAAGLLSAPARADGVGFADLPTLGYQLSLRADLSQPCPTSYWVTGGNGAPETLIGDPSDAAHSECETPAAIVQARIAALVAAFPPPAPPAPTTTDAPVAAPATAAAAPATVDPAAPATVTVTVADPNLAAALASLQAQLDALSKRVDAIAQANTASWDAFVAAIGSGSSAEDAALAARSAGLNAIYQLA